MKPLVLFTLVCLCLVCRPSLAFFGSMAIVETAPGNYQVRAEIRPQNGDTLGIAGYSFNIVGVDPGLVSYEQGCLFAIDPNTFLPRGFPQPIAGPVGDYYSVGSNQATSLGDQEVFGIGIEEVFVEGFQGRNLHTGVPAVLGTITAPAGLTIENFQNHQLALFPADYDGLSNGPTVPFGISDGLVITTFHTGGDLPVDCNFPPIPEPSTLAITTLALAAAVVHRRRKK